MEMQKGLWNGNAEYRLIEYSHSHPSQKREGWGTRRVVAGWGKRIPSLRYGMEMQKELRNGNAKRVVEWKCRKSCGMEMQRRYGMEMWDALWLEIWKE